MRISKYPSLKKMIGISLLFFITLCSLFLIPLFAQDQRPPLSKEADQQEQKGMSYQDTVQEQALAKEVARLIEMVKLPSRDRNLTNWEIVIALTKLGKNAVPALISEMEKSDPVTMPVAMYTIGLIGDKRAIEPLYNLLPPVEEEQNEGPTKTKSSICFTLAAIGDVNSIPLVMQGPYAANRTISAGAISYIGAISTMLGEKAVEPLITVINKYKDDKKVYGAIQALGFLADERAIPLLSSLLGHQDDMVKMISINALAEIGNPSVSGSIIPFLDSKADLVREAAAESMYSLQDIRALKKLFVLAIEDPDPQVRLKSVIALGAYGGKEGFKILLKAAEDKDVNVRVYATEWLGTIGNKKADAILKKRVKDVDARVSLRAVDAYRRVFGEASEGYLLSVLNDSRWVIQREAVRALTGIGARKAAVPIASVLRDAVDEQEKNSNFRDIVLETSTALSELGDAKTIETLKELALKVTDPEVKNLLDGAVHDISVKIENGTDIKKWIKTLREGTKGDQAVSIDMLGRIGDQSATAPLIEQFGKMDVDLSSSIPKALGKIKDPAAIPFLEDLLSSDAYDEKEMYPVRANAAWALGEIKSPSSMAPLEKCLLRYDGEPFSAIVAMAKVFGKEAIPHLLEIKKTLMRTPSPDRMKEYKDVNWLIKDLRNGWSISSLDHEP